MNLGLRYEYYGPQTKSDPKFDSNFYYGERRHLGQHGEPGWRSSMRCATARVFATNESPIGGLWKSDWNNFAPRVGFAWDVNGDGTTSVRGGYGMGYERNFGNVTYNVLFNPPLYLVASIDAPTDVATLPIYTDNAGPFGGVAGVTKTIPAGSLRHVDQNIETAYAHFYGLACRSRFRQSLVGRIEYTGSTAASSTIWPIPTSVAPPSSIGASAPPGSGRTRSTPRSTRAAIAASRSITA